MQVAPIPHNEDARIKALYDFDILDTDEEQAFDDITRLAADICDAPISLISLIDTDRQFLKSHFGLDAKEVSRELGFCPHAILDDNVTVVEDSEQDERFFDNPLVKSGPKVKFYAGAPLIIEDDIRIGTLCIVDHKARSIAPEKIETLQVLARQVVSQLRLRKQNKALTQLNKQHLQTLDELAQARDFAEKSNQAKSKFLSNVTHELRTPLNAVLGYAQLLDIKEEEYSHNKFFAQEIIKSGNHLLELINDILFFSKVESGNIKLDFFVLDAVQLVQECIDLIKPKAQQRNIQIEIVSQRHVNVTADFLRLKQALLNLLSNAIKYNIDGGKVVVSITKSEQAVKLAVADSGKGIPQKDIENLFIPFNRLGEEGGTIEGSGIGLNIAKQLIEMMNGEIGVESQLGLGSTFWLELPNS